MQIFYQLDEIRDAGIASPAVTVGSFDGVHAGHRAILRALGEAARASGGQSVVVTFDPHPRRVLYPDDTGLKLLNSTEEKIVLLGQAGVDNLLVLPFTLAFSRIAPADFARQYLLEGIGAKQIVMGYNHHFGQGRAGDRDYLESLKGAYDFEVVPVSRLEVSDKKVSSTVLRALIGAGALRQAREILTEPYFLIAETAANGALTYTEPAKLLPPAGEYAVTVDNFNQLLDSRLLITAEGDLRLLPPLPATVRAGERVIVRFADSDPVVQG
ncbi:MAG: FAD synthetase [Rikenellaceae bacterium]|jgi:riboflavin kinase/FMN adenylyltransferase|nr:FAD synthetase [Rikenellaceae bacterium]